jgi:predicted nucleic acid-binding protein
MARARIGQGEAEAIILAKKRSVPVILDDAEARAVARSFDLEYMGTLMLPYHAFVRGMLSREELVEILTGLSRVLWVSPDVIAEILRRAEGKKE